jgi:hypothetical protein
MTYKIYKKKLLQATAYHEAGHVVMYFLMEVPFTAVTIFEDGGGRVYDNHRHINRLFPDDFERVTDLQRRMINIYVSGALAEAVYRRDWTTLQANERIDFDLALNVMEDSYFRDDLSVNFINKQRFEALRLLMYPAVWNAIEVLAKFLLIQRKLTGKEATRIVRKVLPEIETVKAQCGVALTSTKRVYSVKNRIGKSQTQAGVQTIYKRKRKQRSRKP